MTRVVLPSYFKWVKWADYYVRIITISLLSMLITPTRSTVVNVGHL